MLRVPRVVCVGSTVVRHAEHASCACVLAPMFAESVIESRGAGWGAGGEIERERERDNALSAVTSAWSTQPTSSTAARVSTVAP